MSAPPAWCVIYQAVVYPSGYVAVRTQSILEMDVHFAEKHGWTVAISDSDIPPPPPTTWYVGQCAS
jgi:hypothetical protein